LGIEQLKNRTGWNIMKEEWLMFGAVVPVDVETTAALVAEIHRLIDVVGGMALKEPVLQEIEQYRLQMAGISTAAIGYWKEGDKIQPDYNTPALRDVAKLYAKYDELYKAQNVTHGVIAGGLFDFMGWLTSRPRRIMLSSADDASPAVDAIKDFAKMRGLSLDDARVQDWQDNTTPPNVATPLAAQQALSDATHLAAPVQEPVSMRMPKVGDKVVCLEDESIGTIVYLTAGGSPEIKFDDGSHGTYMLREFAELFGYTTPPAAQRQWVGLTDEEIERSYETAGHYQTLRPQDRFAVFALAQAIESKLKEKNA
jgi:hypothetical protein